MKVFLEGHNPDSVYIRAMYQFSINDKFIQSALMLSDKVINIYSDYGPDESNAEYHKYFLKGTISLENVKRAVISEYKKDKYISKIYRSITFVNKDKTEATIYVFKKDKKDFKNFIKALKKLKIKIKKHKPISLKPVF